MSALIRLCRVQKCILVFFLITAALCVSIIVIGVVGLYLCRPSIVFAVVPTGVVRVFFLRVVWKDAFAEELVHVVAGDGAGQREEDAIAKR